MRRIKVAGEVKIHRLGCQKAKEYHKTKIWLGVWEHNPQALRFYEKEGLSLQVHMNFILVMS